jgi:hypothetical protein
MAFQHSHSRPAGGGLINPDHRADAQAYLLRDATDAFFVLTAEQCAVFAVAGLLSTSV